MAQSLSGKYYSIDMSRISASAAEILDDLKKETKNFKKITPELREDFNEVYDKLKKSKPQAIRGTEEYKAFGKKEEKPAKKAAPKKKAPAKGKYSALPKGMSKEVKKRYSHSHVDIPRDAGRQAKPFGARVRGKNIRRKPTPADYAAHRVYYEYRPNRADVRKTYPRLEEGGAIEGYRAHAKEHHRLDN